MNWLLLWLFWFVFNIILLCDLPARNLRDSMTIAIGAAFAAIVFTGCCFWIYKVGTIVLLG